MPLRLGGVQFDVVPDLVFTDDQPLPTIRAPIVVNRKVTTLEAMKVRKAIDEDERAILDTACGVGEIEFRSMVFAPDEGVIRQLEGPEVKAWKFRA